MSVLEFITVVLIIKNVSFAISVLLQDMRETQLGKQEEERQWNYRAQDEPGRKYSVYFQSPLICLPC